MKLAYRKTYRTGFRKSFVGESTGFQPELITYTDGLTTPLSYSQKTKLNTFITSLKIGLSISSLSDFFDTIYILANETEESSLRNLVKRSHDCTAVNSPAFATLEGFTGNGSSSYLNTNFNPSTQGDNYTLDNASFGVYLRTNNTTAGADMGCRTGTSNYTAYYPYNSGSTSHRIHNGVAEGVIEVATTTTAGIGILTRTSSSSIALYFNKAESTANVSSVSIPSANFYICARNVSGTAEQYSDRQVSFAFTSKGMTDTQAGIISDAIEEYMDSNNKGVISFTPYDETDLSGYGLTSSQIDEQLAYWVSEGTTNETLIISGNEDPTSSAYDDFVALLAAGNQIDTNNDFDLNDIAP